MTAGDIASAVEGVRQRIARSAARAGRDASDVTIVGATKTVDGSRVAEALAAGIVDVGENRAQELLAKAPLLAAGDPAPRWHFFGRLQRNKIRDLAAVVVCWHSVDRVELAPVLGRHAPGARVLVQVDLAGEPAKGGCEPAAVGDLVRVLQEEGLAVDGLMTVPPRDLPARPWFAQLAAMARDQGLRELSMGMSDDFEDAVTEGATMVRLGRVLFGARPRPAGASAVR